MSEIIWRAAARGRAADAGGIARAGCKDHPPDRAVCGRRSRRCAGARGRSRHEHGARPVRRHRQPRRRGRRARRRRRRQGRAGRNDHRARRLRRDDGAAVHAAGALRRAARPRADHAGRAQFRRAGHASEARLQDGRRSRRVREGEPEEGQFRVGRDRHVDPSVGRALRLGVGHPARARALCQGRGAGDHRSARRPRRHDASRHFRRARTRPLRRAGRVGGHRREALAAIAERADHGRGRLSQGGLRDLVRADRAGEDAAGDAQRAAWRSDGRAEIAGRHQADRAAGLRCRADDAGASSARSSSRSRPSGSPWSKPQA